MNNMPIRKIRTLAHKECCNFIDGKCIEDEECAVINPRYPTIHEIMLAKMIQAPAA